MMFKWLRRQIEPAPMVPELAMPAEVEQEPTTSVREFMPYAVREGMCPTCGVESREDVKFVRERRYDSRYDFFPRGILLIPEIMITPAHLVWTCVA